MKFLTTSLLIIVINAGYAQLHESKLEVKHHYTGLIGGKYKFLMNLYFDNKGNVDGEYRYYNQKDFLKVRGTYNANPFSFNLTEALYDWEKGEAKITGYFEGTRNVGAITGAWFNAERTKSYPFTISTNEKSATYRVYDNSKIKDDILVTDSIMVQFDATHKQYLTNFMSEVSPGTDVVNFEDLNFDGHLDILVVEMTGAKNTPFLYWVFNPTTSQFVRHEELGATDPVVDLQHQQVVSDWVDGAAIHGTDKYIWQSSDAKFYLVESTEIDLSTDKTTVTKYKVENGKSVKLEP
jgi:hypothetical protein